jgi:hypothetical protein
MTKNRTPHIHVLAADGLFTPDGSFHCMPAEDLAAAIKLFRHRFLHALREAKLISPKRVSASAADGADGAEVAA